MTPEVIEAGEKSGQGFAGAGRGENEGILAGGDGGPALPLSGGRLAERGAEPVLDGREEEVRGLDEGMSSLKRKGIGGNTRFDGTSD